MKLWIQAGYSLYLENLDFFWWGVEDLECVLHDGASVCKFGKVFPKIIWKKKTCRVSNVKLHWMMYVCYQKFNWKYAIIIIVVATGSSWCTYEDSTLGVCPFILVNYLWLLFQKNMHFQVLWCNMEFVTNIGGV